MNYHHFTIEERCCLREYYVKGKSYREIAKLLGRNVSSISRELRRNCTFYKDIPRYYPYTAQKKSKLRNSYRHRGMFWKQEVLEYIDKKLSQTWSPETIGLFHIQSSCRMGRGCENGRGVQKRFSQRHAGLHRKGRSAAAERSGEVRT